MNKTEKIGKLGELETARALRDMGCKIIASNFRVRVGEIDIVAEDGEFIRFVEVKTRQNGTLLPAKENVGFEKQRRVKAAASAFLAAFKTSKSSAFDISEVYADGEKVISINYIKNAF